MQLRQHQLATCCHQPTPCTLLAIGRVTQVVCSTGLMQLDVCLEGKDEDDEVALFTPGLPSLVQLTLVWKGGRSDAVAISAADFPGAHHSQGCK